MEKKQIIIAKLNEWILRINRIGDLKEVNEANGYIDNFSLYKTCINEIDKRSKQLDKTIY